MTNNPQESTGDVGGLIERLEVAVKLGTATGARGKHPSNIYNIADEAASQLAALKAENERLREALGDLVSWFPEEPPAKPPEPEWRIRAGEWGADDAVSHARAVLSHTEPKP